MFDNHGYGYHFGDDADYIVWGSWTTKGWVEHTRWMIPGSNLGDQ